MQSIELFSTLAVNICSSEAIEKAFVISVNMQYKHGQLNWNMLYIFYFISIGWIHQNPE